MVEIGINDAKAQFSRLVQLAIDGEEIIVTRHGRPAVKLTVIDAEPRSFADLYGIRKGRVRIADDFDELPADIAEELGMT